MTGWLFLALSVTATVTAQLAFKKHFLARRFAFLVHAIVLFCLAVPFTFLAARDMGIGKVYIGSALSYVLTPIAAHFAFGERLKREQWAALSLIVAGVVVYNL